ncbi:MAG: hypothetical protein IKX65_05540 [Prevotella sp.]|nr:hypothetical protein [Prevotella sp.]
MNKETQEQFIAQLRKRVEETFGQEIKMPKDFDNLSQRINGDTKTYISATTLKRMWGYLSEPVTPRKATLDVLAQYVGFKDWDAFTLGEAGLPNEEPSASKRKMSRVWVTALLVALACAIGLLLLRNCRMSHQLTSMTDSLETVTADKYVIRLGQTFSTYDEYLHLFGITPDDRPWAQPLPGHPEICIWGPEFHNAHWHNDGNPDSLMPTITEYWHVEGADPETVHLRNIDHYTYLRYRKELRVTFMKGLRDSTFTFLGLYVMDREECDTNRIVWQRIAEECDLTHLDYLEQLRR